MSATGRAPIRFLFYVVGGWCALRVAAVLIGGWLVVEPGSPVEAALQPARAVLQAALALADPPIPASDTAVQRQVRVHVDATYRPPLDNPPATHESAPSIPSLAVAIEPAIETPAASSALPAVWPGHASTPRWRGSAWIYTRETGDLAPAGAAQLGGSQAGARLAWQVDGSGRIPLAIVVRGYAPLRTRRGAEAAVGIESEPIAALPLRISVERRIRVTSEGRNAWSAYAAGGLYRELLPGVVGDAYAQAGIVGAHKRDGFVDGALRVGRRWPIARSGGMIVGAGIWGGAQPHANRVDIGPRVALVLPVEAATVTIGVEYRARIAGNARPGSGMALTLATDF
jgi:hypothetical protein